MRFFSLMFMLLFCIHNCYAALQTSTFPTDTSLLHSLKTNSTRQSFSRYLGITGNIGGASYVAFENIISVSYPYTVYDYNNNTTETFTSNPEVNMPGSQNALQFIIGGGLEVTPHRNAFLEFQMNSWAPGTGNNINCISAGGGVTILPRKKNFSVRLGLNFFRLNRSASLGRIDNDNKNVNINGTNFAPHYYEEREEQKVRRKDTITVTVYDIYHATNISVNHNDVYVGVQPKLILSFGSEDQPGIFRLHLGWNLPVGNSRTSVSYKQHGYRESTSQVRPPYPYGQQSLRLDTSNPYLNYQAKGPNPSYTTGFFFKVEIGIRIFTE